MSNHVSIADRAAKFSLGLLAAANLMFFTAFALALVFASSQARAAAPTCDGDDMLARMAVDNPAQIEKMRAEAEATPNGKGLLWKIEKEGREPSWLFGTMHMTDPRVTKLPADARAAFEQSKTLVIETTDVLDKGRMAAAMVEHPELIMFTDDTTLTGLLSAEQKAAVEAGLEERGINLVSVQKMKPWMLAAMVALPACELARQQAGEPVLDAKLARDAKAEGKAVEGLETAVDQLNAMASLPLDFHIDGLVETLKLGDRIDDVIETMIVIYENGDTGMFWPFFHAALPAETGGDTGYGEFQERMIVSRNRKMATNAESILDKGNAFIAVGALHLPGDDGLVSILRNNGYAVTPAG